MEVVARKVKGPTVVQNSSADKGQLTIHSKGGVCTITNVSSNAPEEEPEEGSAPRRSSNLTNADFLLELIGKAGEESAGWKFEVPRPEGKRVITVKNIADYFNTLSPAAFEPIRNSLLGVKGKAMKGIYNALKMFAERAAYAGLGDIASRGETFRFGPEDADWKPGS